MNPYFGLTEQIRQLLATPASHGATVPARELARQYAEACRVAGERLKRCGECLGKGLRSEAIQLAEQTPPLLDTILVLDFPERGRWLELCQRYDIAPPPPDFDADLVGRLNAEYASHAVLEPLLKVYRSVVHVGSLEEKVSILRRLQALDGNNPVWRQNLLPLEREQVSKLAATAQAAVETGELPSLVMAIKELRDTAWLAEQPKELIAGLEAQQKELETRQLKAAMEETCLSLTKACEAGSADMVGVGLDAWKRLGGDAMALASDPQKKTLKQAQNLWDVQQKKVKREREFWLAVAELAQMLEVPDVKRAALEALVNRIENFEENVPPENLMQRGWARLEELKEYERRRMRMLLAVGAVFMMLAGVGLALVARQKGRDEDVRQLQVEMAALAKAKQFPKAASVLDDFLKKAKWAEGNSTVLQLRRQAQEGCALLEKETVEFASLRKKLEEIRDAHFDNVPEMTDAMFQRASALANDEEQKLFLDQWKVARNVREREVAALMEQKLGGIQKKLLALLVEREAIANTMPLPQATAKVAELETCMAEAEKLKGAVSLESREQLAKTGQGVAEVVQAVKIRMENENLRQETWNKALAAIEAGHMSISEYAGQLKSCQDRDAGWATEAECRMAEKHLALAAALRGRSSFPADLAKGEQTAWSETISQCINYDARAEVSRKALLELLGNKMFTSLRILTLELANNRAQRKSFYYVLGSGKVFKHRNAGGKRSLYYEQPEMDDGNPMGYSFQRKEISSLECWFPDSGEEVDNKQAALIPPHVKYLSGFAEELRNTAGDDLVPFLLTKAQGVGGWQGVSPAFQAAWAKELLAAATAIDPTLAKDEPVARACIKLEGSSFHCAWLDASTGAGGPMNNFAAWGNFAAAQEVSKARMAAMDTAMSRRFSFCGIVKQPGDVPEACLHAGPWQELWVVVNGGTAPPTFHIVATLDKKSGKFNFLESEKALLKKGTPLLAPTDGLGTATLAAKFAGAGSLTSAWPVNAKAGN